MGSLLWQAGLVRSPGASEQSLLEREGTLEGTLEVVGEAVGAAVPEPVEALIRAGGFAKDDDSVRVAELRPPPGSASS